jgi:hypothetical protein
VAGVVLFSVVTAAFVLVQIALERNTIFGGIPLRAPHVRGRITFEPQYFLPTVQLWRLRYPLKNKYGGCVCRRMRAQNKKVLYFPLSERLVTLCEECYRQRKDFLSSNINKKRSEGPQAP